MQDYQPMNGSITLSTIASQAYQEFPPISIAEADVESDARRI